MRKMTLLKTQINYKSKYYSVMIPKILYQTWDTNMHNKKIQERLDIMKDKYSGYEYKFFLDNDLDDFVHEHFDGDILECYQKLNIIVAKVDFWRYLILYKFGGVYLDFDSELLEHLDTIIRNDDKAIVSMENNPDPDWPYFCQWALMFEAGHPILKRVIEMIVENIKENKYPNDIHKMTGPGVFTKAVQSVHFDLFHSQIKRSDVLSKREKMEFRTPDVQYRILGVDFEEKLRFKIPEWAILFEGRIKWHKQQKKDPLLIF